jgi:hypothetical protein
MDGACITHSREEKFVQNLKERNQLNSISRLEDGIIFQRLRACEGEDWIRVVHITDWWFGYCEHGDKPSGAIKGGKLRLY